MLSFLVLPGIVAVSLMACYLRTLSQRSDAPEMPDVASTMIDDSSPEQVHEAVGGRAGTKKLYGSAVDMLRYASNRPELSRTRDAIAVMTFCLYLVSRWYLWFAAPIAAMVGRMPIAAERTMASIYNEVAASYTAATER